MSRQHVRYLTGTVAHRAGSHRRCEADRLIFRIMTCEYGIEWIEKRVVSGFGDITLSADPLVCGF